MLQKKKIFYFSEKTLGYHEVKYFTIKALLSVAVSGVALFGLLYVLNFLLGDPLNVTTRTDIAAENNVLKDQVRQLIAKSTFVQKSMDELSDRNNQLRLMVDLKTIDAETKKASTGGSLNTAEFGFLGREAGTLLTNSYDILSKLEREVNLQKKSYEEINKQYRANQTMFKHLPAIKPAEGPYSVNGFGMRIHPVLSVWRMHEGLDIIADIGTPVYASGDGLVRFAGRTRGGYGSVIEIDHGYGYTTLYAHLSKIHTTQGSRVKRGELIGRVGRSGLVSGPHLHYEVRLNGRQQNPMDYFFDDVDATRYRAQLAQAK